jgi:hypothetical protein
MSISTVVVFPSASLEQLARNLRTTNSYTRFSSPLVSFVQAVGWMGGCALSFLRPFRGRLKPPFWRLRGGRRIHEQQYFVDEQTWGMLEKDGMKD